MHVQELGREGEAGGSGKGFAFQQLEGDGQAWQPAFLTSIDHRPSVTAETPTFPPPALSQDADDPGEAADEDGADAITPLSEVSTSLPRQHFVGPPCVAFARKTLPLQYC